MRILYFLALTILFPVTLFSQVFINEASNANGTLLPDNEGNTPDWIEIYNGSLQTVNLGGYGLTDKLSEPLKWVFPNYSLAPNSFLTVFASGKNTFEIVNHYETAVFPENNWKYLIPDQNTPSNWNSLNFSTSGWTNTTLGIGYGDDDDVNILSEQVASIYLRRKFIVSDTSKILKAILDIDFDDGFVAYLNGVEIARSGLGGFPPAWDEFSADHEATIYQGENPEMYTIDELTLKNAIKNDTNVLAIEVHNSNIASSDLSLIPYLTFGFEDATTYYNGNVHPYFNTVLSTVFHTNFTIKSEGEAIYLANTQGVIIDSLDVPDLDNDMSYGRKLNGSPNFYYFTIPTPSSSNNASQAFTAFEPKPDISFSGGFYTQEVSVSVINNSTTSGVLRYTLNGQNPVQTSPLYTDTLQINTNSVLKVRCFPVQVGILPSDAATESYFFMEDFTLPVISITTDDVHLYGSEGIFDNPTTDWRKPCFIEYFDSTGHKILDSKASIKPDGGAGGSRTNPQHSVTIEPSNDVYGEGKPILYPLIPEKSYINEYHAFYLRNGSNMWNQYPQRDATFMRIMRESNANSQAYTPVIVYLNGEYFGVYELREKAKAEYFESNYGNDPDSLDLLSVSFFYGPSIIREVEGSDSSFYTMHDFVSSYDPNNADYFNKCHEKLDLYNFTDYLAAENWFANYDWIYNNMKLARTRTAGNRWRFFLQDMELGLGVWGDYTSNLFDYLRYDNQPNPFSEIYLALLENDQFHNYFINRYADLMNTTFQEESYKPIVKDMYLQLLPEMPRQFETWTGDIAGGMETFSDNFNLLLYQFVNRNASVRDQIVAEFSLQQQVSITLDAEPEGAGYIRISTIVPRSLPWTGVYFDGVPVEITAVPNPGYEFVSWEHNTEIPGGELTNPHLNLNVDSDETFSALFTGSPAELMLTVSEINYNTDPSINGGNWIELHNYDTTDLHLGSWAVKSKNFYDKFTFPVQTMIPAKGYLVICEDTNLFKSMYPGVTNFIGPTEFAWSNSKDSIRIYDPFNNLKVLAIYSDSLPYPECADGWGRTLELSSTGLSLLDPSSWFCGCVKGSPGEAFKTCEEQVIFTEINYNTIISPYYTGDWVEIKNNSDQEISLQNYVFKDSKDDHIFNLPAVILPPDSFYVLLNDPIAFQQQHEDVSNFTGIFDFGLSDNSEVVRLYDASGQLVTSVLYKSETPWTSMPKDGNYTLEFRDSVNYFNASDAASWFAGCLGGSPGRAYKPCYTLEENVNLGIFPNPATSTIMLVYDNNDQDLNDSELSIFDLNGRVLYFEEIHSKDVFINKEVNVEFLANGMYFVQFKKAKEKVQKAFVKL